MSLKKNYSSYRNYKGHRIDGIPCQKISFLCEDLKKYVSTKKIYLEVPFVSLKRNDNRLILPCVIHRAYRIDNNTSHLVVWAPKRYVGNIQRDWKSYVKTLQLAS
jgi:hypothetical protein